mmetsp:Transcript_5462/g.8432  ORF Transcript_5462/g.8432 Transcript_5462/m.8432 type:complete len:90 (-) Transcript_5462:182-451(-)
MRGARTGERELMLNQPTNLPKAQWSCRGSCQSTHQLAGDKYPSSGVLFPLVSPLLARVGHVLSLGPGRFVRIGISSRPPHWPAIGRRAW